MDAGRRGLELTILGAAAAGSNVLVHVTAYDDAGYPGHCKPASWRPVGNDLVLEVSCFSMNDNLPFDDGYQMSSVKPPA